jgi:hypothetical protein
VLLFCASDHIGNQQAIAQGGFGDGSVEDLAVATVAMAVNTAAMAALLTSTVESSYIPQVRACKK